MLDRDAIAEIRDAIARLSRESARLNTEAAQLWKALADIQGAQTEGPSREWPRMHDAPDEDLERAG